MEKQKTKSRDWFEVIVGNGNVNVGIARLLLLVLVFIIVFGTIMWAILPQ
ncbi:hypothetical protein [Rhizobium sp. R693]|nr:hypothetical protein [Rhizobium sp. R693]